MSLAVLQRDSLYLARLYLLSRSTFDFASGKLESAPLPRRGESAVHEIRLPGIGLVLDEPSFRRNLAKKARRKLYLNELRETILVRLVSSLEVFLVDQVRMMFLQRRDLFHRQDKVELPIAQLLSFNTIEEAWGRILETDCRRLHSGGFQVIQKYYRARLDIDLESFKATDGTLIDAINEAHERRHLLVHALGRTDAQYRANYHHVGPTVSVNEGYLLATFGRILEFGTFVERACSTRCGRPTTELNDPRIFRLRLDLEAVSADARHVLNRALPIDESGDRCLGDILESLSVHGDSAVMVLAGKQGHVKKYLKLLGREKGAGLIIRHKEVISRGHACNVPDQILLEIAKALPQRPWPRDIHKSIARDFALSSSRASKALSLISAHPDRYGFAPTTGSRDGAS